LIDKADCTGKPERQEKLTSKGLQAKEIAQALETSARTVQRYLLLQKEQFRN